MPPNRSEKAKELFRTLLEIYWPLILFGGIRLVYVLAARGPAHLWRTLVRFFAEPDGHRAIFYVVILAAVLTPLLMILILTDRDGENVRAASPHDEDADRFPELNYRLKPSRKSGRIPQPVEKVIIPRTVPASSACRPSPHLRVLLGDREELSAPLSPGTHKVHVDGCIVTVTVERESGTIAEDITKELPLPQ